MNKILDEREIDGINSFITDVVKIPFVEAVYLFPYSEEDGSVTCEVVTVYNQSLHYNKLLTGQEAVRDYRQEHLDLSDIVVDYNKLLGQCGFSFDINSSIDYNPLLLHKREFAAMSELVDGTILFDRFGNITRVKEEVEDKRLIHPAGNIVEIDNISRVIPSTDAISQLVKTKEA